MILVFLTPSTDTQFPGKPLQRGHKIHGVEKNLRFSTEIFVFLGNGRRQANDYYVTLIGSYTWRIDMCRFR